MAPEFASFTGNSRGNSAPATQFVFTLRYYLREELTEDDPPVSLLAAQRADHDQWRKASLRELRRLFNDHSSEIEIFGYHGISELPGPWAAEMGEDRCWHPVLFWSDCPPHQT